MIRKNVSSGDTLIEVLFAVTVFSLVAVGSLSIMNQGATTAQRSLETTLVRQEIDAQAETLRFIHDSYIAAYPLIPDVATGLPSTRWSAIVGKSSTDAATVFGDCNRPTGAFILNTKTAKLDDGAGTLTSTVPTYAQLRYTSTVLDSAEGVWIQAVRTKIIEAGDSSSSIDFHIRACWDAPGQSTSMKLGTIVRLYEPIP